MHTIPTCHHSAGSCTEPMSSRPACCVVQLLQVSCRPAQVVCLGVCVVWGCQRAQALLNKNISPRHVLHRINKAGDMISRRYNAG
jgi:hypothetical protein